MYKRQGGTRRRGCPILWASIRRSESSFAIPNGSTIGQEAESRVWHEVSAGDHARRRADRHYACAALLGRGARGLSICRIVKSFGRVPSESSAAAIRRLICSRTVSYTHL